MPRRRPNTAQIAVLRYIDATRRPLSDPSNLQVAEQCVAHGWLVGGVREGFDLTQEGVRAAAEA